MKNLLKTLIFTVLVPGTVTVLIPGSLLRGSEVSFLGYRSLGFPVMALGAAIYFRCAWDFAFAGRGTPAPFDPPQRLVAKGLYRLVRNPMYVGVLLVLFGESIFFASARLAQYALFVWLMFHLFVILYEEPVLGAKFGSGYEDYCRNVRRWLPRRPPAAPPADSSES